MDLLFCFDILCFERARVHHALLHRLCGRTLPEVFLPVQRSGSSGDPTQWQLQSLCRAPTCASRLPFAVATGTKQWRRRRRRQARLGGWSHDRRLGESWLTAAIPIENPYCSCKLTRVRGVAGGRLT